MKNKREYIDALVASMDDIEKWSWEDLAKGVEKIATPLKTYNAFSEDEDIDYIIIGGTPRAQDPIVTSTSLESSQELHENLKELLRMSTEDKQEQTFPLEEELSLPYPIREVEDKMAEQCVTRMKEREETRLGYKIFWTTVIISDNEFRVISNYDDDIEKKTFDVVLRRTVRRMMHQVDVGTALQ
jgi:hypothetical protein